MNNTKYTYFCIPPNSTNKIRFIEPINELDKYGPPYKEIIMNTTLRTQADAFSAIKQNQFVIGSVAANGDFSLSASPVPHSDAGTARLEANRLARLSPGKAFVIMKLHGAEMVPTNTISI